MRHHGKVLIAALFMGVTTAATAVTVQATLIRDYPLTDSPDGLMGGPSVVINPDSAFTGDGLQFGVDAGPIAAGDGATLLFPDGVPVSDYSIAFDIRLDSPSYQATTETFNDPFGGGSTTTTTYPTVKLIDFKELTVDAGVYINNDGIIEFFGIGAFGTTVFQPDRDYHFAFTRDRNEGLQAYLDGAPQFTPGTTDPNGEALITADSLAFLLDDNVTTDPQAAGIFSFLQIFTGTLTQQEVSVLAAQGGANRAAAVPTPASLLLMIFGVAMLRRQQVRKRAAVAATAPNA